MARPAASLANARAETISPALHFNQIFANQECSSMKAAEKGRQTKNDLQVVDKRVHEEKRA